VSSSLILLFGLMLATVLVMATGMVAMFRGGEFNRKYGNKLMIARVTLQAVTIGFIGLLVLAGAVVKH
jgi:Hypoxia induced protein conserved region